MIDTDSDRLQGIIVTPTRELALQVRQVISDLGEHLGVQIYACVGGTMVKDDIIAFQKKVHVLVATPGRMLDLLKRKCLDLSYVLLCVLDEADEMLSRGFKENIKTLFMSLPSNVQVGLFSATLPEEILAITADFMRDPVKILVKKENLTLEGIRQYYVAIPEDNLKVDVLVDIYKNIDIQQAIIYCNTKRRVESVYYDMKQKGFTIAYTHGDMPQEYRSKIMKDFRTGAIRVVVCTDLLARGIDVQQVSLVVNYDLPTSKEVYLHRIGRSGRFGRKGTAISIVTPRDGDLLKEIETYHQTEICKLPHDLGTI